MDDYWDKYATRERPGTVKSGDMAAMLKRDKEIMIDNNGGRIYKSESCENKAQVLSSTLGDVTEVLKRDQIKHIKRVNFDDLEEVKQRTIEYFEACQASRHYPSVMTLCAIGYGCGRDHFLKYLNSHNNESSNYMQRVKDLIADILTNASLYGTADNVSVIFQLKNLHGFADNIRVEAGPVMPDVEVDKEAIRKRHTFKDITPEDDDE
jgi:hypothetical protein